MEESSVARLEAELASSRLSSLAPPWLDPCYLFKQQIGIVLNLNCPFSFLYAVPLCPGLKSEDIHQPLAPTLLPGWTQALTMSCRE